MNKKDVLEHFGGSPRTVAEAIGVTAQYVSQWPAKVPEAMAARLEKITEGALEYDVANYRR